MYSVSNEVVAVTHEAIKADDVDEDSKFTMTSDMQLRAACVAWRLGSAANLVHSSAHAQHVFAHSIHFNTK